MFMFEGEEIVPSAARALIWSLTLHMKVCLFLQPRFTLGLYLLVKCVSSLFHTSEVLEKIVSSAQGPFPCVFYDSLPFDMVAIFVASTSSVLHVWQV